MTKKSKIILIVAGVGVAVLGISLGLVFGLEGDSDVEKAKTACLKSFEENALELDKISCKNALAGLSNDEKAELAKDKEYVEAATKAALKKVGA